MKVLEKSTPLRRNGEGATLTLPGQDKLTAEQRILHLSPRDKKFYVPAGDHPWGFSLFIQRSYPARGRLRRVEGCYRGLTTDELDALEAFADQEAEARFADECDAIVKERVYGEIPELHSIDRSGLDESLRSLDRIMSQEGVT